MGKRSIMPIIPEPPVYEAHLFSPKRNRYCIVVVVLNEGQRLKAQLARIKS